MLGLTGMLAGLGVWAGVAHAISSDVRSGLPSRSLGGNR